MMKLFQYMYVSPYIIPRLRGGICVRGKYVTI